MVKEHRKNKQKEKIDTYSMYDFQGKLEDVIHMLQEELYSLEEDYINIELQIKERHHATSGYAPGRILGWDIVVLGKSKSDV